MFRWPASAPDASRDREGAVPVPRMFARRQATGRIGAAVLCASVLCATALTAQTTVFKTKVQLVHVIATVKNPDGEPAGALEKSDFTISDNGVRQEIAFFQRTTEQALSIVLLIDTSCSTGKPALRSTTPFIWPRARSNRAKAAR